MRSTFHGIETAKRSLFTHQAALQTTAHNVANASNPAYSRQIVNMRAARPIEAVGMTHSAVPGQLGTGVEFSSITRVRERFLDDQFRNQNKELGSWTVQHDTLEKLEKIVNEPSDSGIRTVLERFWKAWSDLSKDPERIDGRKVVREAAMALADAFNHTSRQLEDLKNDLTKNIQLKTDEINSLLTAIADLNREIYRIEGLGDNANDLRDQRDYLTDKLSKIVNITVQETASGYTITMGNTQLVNGATASTVTAEGLTAAFGGDLTGGELYGMIRSRDVLVTQYEAELDTLVNTIANGEVTVTIPAGSVLPEGTVVKINGVEQTLTGAQRYITEDTKVTVNGLNGLHKLGYLLTDPPKAGGDFFVGNTAATFRLNPAIEKDPTLIATSMRTAGSGSSESVVTGNNTLALLISELKSEKFVFQPSGGGQSVSATVDDYWGSVVGVLGVQAQEAGRQADNQRVLVDQVDARRQSVSGVSLDEEMANMIKFQHAYNAAARVMTVYDEILDRIINGMGVVGR